MMGLVLATAFWAIVIGGGLMLFLSHELDGMSFGIFASSLAITVVLVGAVAWYNWATTYRNDHVATCHVTKSDRGGDDGSYRIYTSDCGQLSNEDSNLRWKKNSGDLWERIPADGGVCVFRIAGSRWHPVSQFPNVFEADCVADAA